MLLAGLWWWLVCTVILVSKPTTVDLEIELWLSWGCNDISTSRSFVRNIEAIPISIAEYPKKVWKSLKSGLNWWSLEGLK